MDSTIAKRFLVSRVIDRAESEHLSLSDVEIKMLHFTGVHSRLPDTYAVSAEFEWTITLTNMKTGSPAS